MRKLIAIASVVLLAFPAIGAQLYFKAGTTTNWSDSGNWYTDIDGTTPAGTPPTSGDDAYFCAGETNCTVDGSAYVDLGTGTCGMSVYVSGGTIASGNWTSYPYIGSGSITGGTFVNLYVGGGTVSGGMFTGYFTVGSYASATISGGTMTGTYDGGGWGPTYSSPGPTVSGVGLTNCYLYFNASNMQGASGWSFQSGGSFNGVGSLTTSGPTGTGNNASSGATSLSVGPFAGTVQSLYAESTFDGGTYDCNIYLTTDWNGTYATINAGTYSGRVDCSGGGYPSPEVRGGTFTGSGSDCGAKITGGVWKCPSLTLSGQTINGLFVCGTLTFSGSSWVTGGIFSAGSGSYGGVVDGGIWASGAVKWNGVTYRVPKNTKPTEFKVEAQFSDVLGGGQ